MKLGRLSFFSLCRWQELQPVEGERPFDPRHVKAVCPEDFEVTKSVAEAQFVVRLELVAVAGPADALKVLAAVRVASL